MHLSVIATTRGRLEPLERLLDSLAAQEYRDFSLLLGDQNPPGFLDEVLARHAGSFSVSVARLKPCGLSAARNQLLPLAQGSCIALADDDCYYAPDAFSQVARYVQAYPLAGALVGTGLPSPSLPCAWTPPRSLSRFAVFSRTPSWCLFLNREGVRKVGDFDENLGIGSSTPWQSGEETDYLLRFLEAGYPVLRAPSVRIFHDADNPASCNTDKIRSYGMGRMRLLAKHGFPLWFRLANIAYPLFRLFVEYPFDGPGAARRRIAMFRGRWQGLWDARKG